ncbi:hypothetical protein DICA2_B06326 [Diutina catenulata]
MNEWLTSNVEGGLGSGAGVFGGGTSVADILSYKDPLLAKARAGRKALEYTYKYSPDTLGEYKLAAELVLAISDGDTVTFESMLRNHPELVNQVYPLEEGMTPLAAAICFRQQSSVAVLLANGADPDLADTLVGYSPLMWAIHFDDVDSVKQLLSHQADAYAAPKGEGQAPIDLVTPDRPAVYEYFSSHNMLRSKEGEDVYGASEFAGVDPTSAMAGLSLTSPISADFHEEEPTEDYEDSEERLATDYELGATKEYDYNALQKEQYIKFTDSDIPSLLDYLFGLRIDPQWQHDVKLPAAVLFQLLRYSHSNVESRELSEFLFDCFISRLRSVTNTTSGVYNMAAFDGGANDIVLLSYWLAVIQFFHFYLAKGRMYRSYPKWLQELINMTQSLVVALSFAINSRLDPLVDPCLLDFTSLVDVQSVLYAKDWNFYRSKKKHPNSFDDIQRMLYPPSMTELMKPSPLKYIQVLAALDYVLRIHHVDKLLRMMAFSQVFYYSNAVLFNRIMSSSRYCTRAKAVQIRLNISAIEDWLRTHSFKVETAGEPGGLGQLREGGATHTEDLLPLANLLFDNWDGEGKCRDPAYLAFYYNSLYSVGKTQFQPAIELLQWLQVMSSCTDQEFLVTTINQFDVLNYFQLHKVMNKLYKYEVDEPKLNKKLVSFVKQLAQQEGERQVEKLPLHYMTQSNFLSKEEYIYLNPNWIFNVALPNKKELINKYGAGLGGVRVLRAKKYQPSLPITIMDAVDDIIEANANSRMNEYEQSSSDDEDDDNEGEVDDREGSEEKGAGSPEKPDSSFHGDEIFKQVQMPSSLMHKDWSAGNDFEENPW